MTHNSDIERLYTQILPPISDEMMEELNVIEQMAEEVVFDPFQNMNIPEGK